MKHVHPDFFVNAPEAVRQVNSQGVQEVNEYLQALRLFTDQKGVEAKTISFYIKKPIEKGVEQGKEKERDFLKFSYEMTALRDGCSSDLKQRHYLTVVEGLSRALHTLLDDFEFAGENEADQDPLSDGESGGYRFRSQSSNWQDGAEAPVKPAKQLAQLQREFEMGRIEDRANKQVHQELRNVVLKNIYR